MIAPLFHRIMTAIDTRDPVQRRNLLERQRLALVRGRWDYSPKVTRASMGEVS